MTPSQASAPDPVAGKPAATSTTRESPPRSSVVACLLAFLASFCVMVVELVAGRLIAKHVGFSLYTWTSVIGVVLAGIMCGNLAGGRLADRYEPRRVGRPFCFVVRLQTSNFRLLLSAAVRW